jgi:hypothetical protein
MTKRDFFKIMIKLFGLYSLVITLFSVVPQIITSITFARESYEILLWTLGSVVIVFLFFLFILSNADGIIDKLKLDKGFDEERIELGNLNNESIFKFAIILIGCFLITDNISWFLNLSLTAFRNKALPSEYLYQKNDYSNWIVCFLNLVIGCLLIANYRGIARFLNKE